MTPKNIWLIKNDENDYSWCDSPDPSDGIEEADVTKYVRADSHLSLDEVIVKIQRLDSRDFVGEPLVSKCDVLAILRGWRE